MRFIQGFILVMALTAVSCRGTEKSAEAPRKVKYESVVANNENVECVTFPGKVVAATDVNLGFRVAGIIEEICATDGTFVRKGEVVARLDKRDYALQLSATQAEYDAVKAEVDRVVALYADESVSANAYDKATSSLRAITAKKEAHQNALADTELRAPFDGYVQKSNFDKGEAVAAGTPVISIISASAPELTIDIPTAYYLKMKNFEQAEAAIDIYGDKKFNLKLKSSSPKANLNQLHKVTFTLEGVDGLVPSAGVSAMVEISYLSDSAKSTTIPFSAIVERGGKSSVWVLSEGRVSAREVEVAEIQSSGIAKIKSGLTEGERVVTAGVNSLKEGQKVSPLEKPAASNIGGIK